MNTRSNVDIWLTRLDTLNDAHLGTCRALLCPEEKQRLARFVALGAAQQFLVARALLRSTLSRYRDVAPRDWTFQQNQYGRPSVCTPDCGQALSFNVSHTDGLVVCAVSETARIGIDVENLSRQLDFHGLARHSFSEHEVAALELSTDEELVDKFYSLWTLKESYIKARGMGLSIPLDSFGFTLGHAGHAIRFSPSGDDNADAWQFHTWCIDHTHRLALAIQSSEDVELDVRLHWTTPDISHPPSLAQRVC